MGGSEEDLLKKLVRKGTPDFMNVLVMWTILITLDIVFGTLKKMIFF